MAPKEEVKETPTATPAITMEQLMAFAQEIKKPSLEEQEKQAIARDRLLARKAADAKSAAEIQAIREAGWNTCPHLKEDGRHNFVGQIHGNGLFKAMCQSCHWCSDWFEPFPEMVNGGAELRDYKGMTRGAIEERSKQLKAKQVVA